MDHVSWSMTLKLAAACRSIYMIFKRKTRAPFFVAILVCVCVCVCVYTCKWDVAVCVLWQAGGCKVTGWINEPRRCVKVPWFCSSNWSSYPLQTKTSSKQCDLMVCSCNLKTWHSFLRFDEFAELQAQWTCWDDGSRVVVGPCDGELHFASLKSKFCPSMTQTQSLSLLGSLVPCLVLKEIECWCSCWIECIISPGTMSLWLQNRSMDQSPDQM
jgi:hypothetical protein